MKTQSISNQNFTAGKVIFINKHFIMKPFDRISLYMPERIGTKQIEAAEKKLKGKDYDVFIYRTDKDLNMFEFRAGQDYYKEINQKPVCVHENVIKSVFSEAVDSAIEAYEKAKKIL